MRRRIGQGGLAVFRTERTDGMVMFGRGTVGTKAFPIMSLPLRSGQGGALTAWVPQLLHGLPVEVER